MFSFRLAEEFKKRASDIIGPFPRGLVSMSASSASDNSRLGAYSALGAIGLGVVMLVANIAHNRGQIPIAATPSSPPAIAAEPSRATVAVKALPAAEPDALAVAVSPASPVEATDKATMRVDNSTTGAIATESQVHPKHKPRLKPKKKKDLDSRN